MGMVQLWIGLYILLGSQKLFVISEDCKENKELYIYRGPNIYCKKIVNCRPGHEIKPCLRTCEEERCVPCSSGTVQYYLSHSDDEPRKFCFKPQKQCSYREETIPIQNGNLSMSCPSEQYCECNINKCFYGSPCICQRNFEVCAENEEMNRAGVCVPCRPGYRKPYEGCDQCEKIQLDKTSQKPVVTTDKPTTVQSTEMTTQKLTTKITKATLIDVIKVTSPDTSDTASPQGPVTQPSKQTNESDDKTVLIVVVVLVIIAIIAVLIIFLVCYKLRQMGRPLCASVVKVFCKEKAPRDDENPVIIDNINYDNRNPPRVVIPTRIDSNGSTVQSQSHESTDSGFPSLQSQTSHVSVSTPIQVEEGDADPEKHPLLKHSISTEQDSNCHSMLLPSASSPVSGPSSLTSDPSAPESYGSSFAAISTLNEHEEINLDVKESSENASEPQTDSLPSGHEHLNVRVGRTCTEHEEETEQKNKLSSFADSSLESYPAKKT